jgi:hypothetical protein
VASLAFVSQKNQARRLQRFLTKTTQGSDLLEKLKGQTELVFLDWADKNEPIADELHELAATLGNAKITRVALPGSALVITKAKYRDLNSIYDSLLQSKSKLEIALMLSFEGHYVLLADKLIARGAQLHFLEDGLGTYVHALAKSRVEIPGLPRTYYLALRGLVGPVLVQNQHFTFRGILTRFIREIIWGTVGKQIQNKERLIQGFRNFAYSYSSFPKLSKKLFPKAHHIKVDFALAMLDEIQDPELNQLKKTFDPADSVFISQAYSFELKLLEGIFHTALNSISGRLWIKLHPRTSPELKQNIMTAVANEPRLELLKDISPAENLIRALRPHTVFGLTSTSLTYAGSLSPASKIVSLSEYAIAELSTARDSRSRRTLKALEADSQVLGFFPEVDQLKRKPKKR